MGSERWSESAKDVTLRLREQVEVFHRNSVGGMLESDLHIQQLSILLHREENIGSDRDRTQQQVSQPRSDDALAWEWPIYRMEFDSHSSTYKMAAFSSLSRKSNSWPPRRCFLLVAFFPE